MSPLRVLQVGCHDQQQHHTSGRDTTPAHLPCPAQLPAFQLRVQPWPGQGPATEHMLGGAQAVRQRGMPGLQAVTGGPSLYGLQPALQDGSMLTLGGTNPMLGSSMLLDSPGGQLGAQPCLIGHTQTNAL